MNANWRPVFAGADGDRPFKLQEYNDGGDRALKVVTTYGKDEILGDGVATIGLPVSADEEMHIDAQTPEELHAKLLENGFSEIVAAQIVRHARLPSSDQNDRN
ncbi:hypothetical protein G4G28_05445 [Massilia sp. Dwa41.01b]|uniref:hypothetical protein n=1 Tax=unclassified Massilia TaxID=2609279 RepID=UPI001601AA68|nr:MULTISPECIES: hypothetical protein [unclassified Massilia]QNA88068.1 hypothetical protein G4G28_05445 [Massilia sp. Dwa41.01b]QNA98975.1 hypothetical protein G4G31_09165 [Massilia sp. Se16.2.3]